MQEVQKMLQKILGMILLNNLI
jgi:hypothetical protein